MWIGGDGMTVSGDSLRLLDQSRTVSFVEDSPDGALTPREGLEAGFVIGFGADPGNATLIETNGFFSSINYEFNGSFNVTAIYDFEIEQNLFASPDFPDAHALTDIDNPLAERQIVFGAGTDFTIVTVDQFSATSVPEPSSVALLVAGMGFAFFRRRRR